MSLRSARAPWKTSAIRAVLNHLFRRMFRHWLMTMDKNQGLTAFPARSWPSLRHARVIASCGHRSLPAVPSIE
jgi:hypothetical protein